MKSKQNKTKKKLKNQLELKMNGKGYAFNPRKVPRNFLTNEEKQEILRLSKMGYSSFRIAKKLNHEERQIKNFLREKQQNAENKFTREQDKSIIEQIMHGNRSPTSIAKLLNNKTDWMVRNRIKFFKRRVFSFADISDVVLFLDQFHDKIETQSSIDVFDSFDIDIFPDFDSEFNF